MEGRSASLMKAGTAVLEVMQVMPRAWGERLLVSASWGEDAGTAGETARMIRLLGLESGETELAAARSPSIGRSERLHLSDKGAAWTRSESMVDHSSSHPLLAEAADRLFYPAAQGERDAAMEGGACEITSPFRPELALFLCRG